MTTQTEAGKRLLREWTDCNPDDTDNLPYRKRARRDLILAIEVEAAAKCFELGEKALAALIQERDAAVSARQEAERVLARFVEAFGVANRDASAGYGWDALTNADSEARATLARTREPAGEGS